MVVAEVISSRRGLLPAGRLVPGKGLPEVERSEPFRGAGRSGSPRARRGEVAGRWSVRVISEAVPGPGRSPAAEASRRRSGVMPEGLYWHPERLVGLTVEKACARSRLRA